MNAPYSWVFIAAAWVLAAAAWAGMVWAVFWDRARRRQRCPRCWYDMADARPDDAGVRTCPECGKSPLGDRELGRTRRRWGLVALGVLVLLAAPFVANFPELRRRGWMFVIPDRVLFYAVPIGGMDGSFGQELLRRIGVSAWPDGAAQATLSAGARAALIRRAAAGTMLARPVGSAWRATYGTLLRNYQRFLYNPFSQLPGSSGPADPAPVTEAVEALRTIPFVLTVRTRDRWPRDIPPNFEFKVEHWWPVGTFDQVSNLQWSTAAGSSGDSRGGRGSFALPIHDTGPVTVTMQLDVVQENSMDSRRSLRTAGHEERTVRYTVVDSIDDVLAPVSDAGVDAALKSGLTLREQTPGDLQIDTHALVLTGLEDVAFGMAMEVTHNGRAIMTAHARWLGGSPNSWTFGNTDIAGDWQATKKYVEENGANPGWVLHIWTDPAWSLAVFDAERYWQGDLSFPIAVNVGPLIWTTRTIPAKK